MMTRILVSRNLTLICSSVILGIIFNVVIADQSPLFPSPRFEHSSVFKGSTLYFIGGISNSDNPFYALDVSPFVTPNSPLPKQLSFTDLSPTVNNFPFINNAGLNITSTVMCGPENELIYIFTNKFPQVIISTYNITSRTFQVRDSQRQIGSWRTTQAICNNRRILLFKGGQEVVTDDSNVITPHALLYYDLVSLTTLTNESHGDLKIKGLVRSLFVQLTNGNVLMIGGKRMKTDGTFEYRSMSELNIYDPDTNTWTSTNAMGQIPDGRESFSLSPTQDGRLILYGGINNINTNPISPDIAVLDTTSNPFSWSTPEIASPIPSRYSHTANVVGNKLIVAFGLIIREESSVPTSELHVLDISTAHKFIWIRSYSLPPFSVVDQSVISQRVDYSNVRRRNAVISSLVNKHKTLFIILITTVPVVILLLIVIIVICRSRRFHDDVHISQDDNDMKRSSVYEERSPSIYSQRVSTASYRTSHDRMSDTSRSLSEGKKRDKRSRSRRGDTTRFVIIDINKKPDQTLVEQDMSNFDDYNDSLSIASSETGSVVQKRRDEEYQSIGDVSKRDGINFGELGSVRADLKDVVNVSKRGGVDFTPILEEESERENNEHHDGEDHAEIERESALSSVISAYRDYWDEEDLRNLHVTSFGGLSSVYSEGSSASSQVIPQYTVPPPPTMVTTRHSPITQYSTPMDRIFTQSRSSVSHNSLNSSTSSYSQRSQRLITLPSSPRDGFTPTSSLINFMDPRKPELVKKMTKEFTVVTPTSPITLRSDSDGDNEDTAGAKQSKFTKKKSSILDFRGIGPFGMRKSQNKNNNSNNNNNNSNDNNNNNNNNDNDMWG